MRLQFSIAAAVIAGMATVAGAGAQQPAGIKLSDVAGRWEAKSMMGPNDSVVTTFTLNARASRKGWSIMFPGRKHAVPTRVVASGGDSIVTETGPYPSVLRPGQTVKVLRAVLHRSGDTMAGTFSAEYTSGDKIDGKIAATRAKKPHTR